MAFQADNARFDSDESLDGVIQQIERRTEQLPRSKESLLRRSALLSLLPPLAWLLVFFVMILLLYLFMMVLTGRPFSGFNCYEVFIIAVLFLFVGPLMRFVGKECSYLSAVAMIIGGTHRLLLGIVNAQAASVTRSVERFLHSSFSEHRQITVYDIIIYSIGSDSTYPVRMYGQLTGSTLAQGDEVTFHGLWHEGTFLSFGGVNREHGSPGIARMFACQPVAS